MIIYVGRWDILPEDWEGINGLYEKGQDEIRAEIDRQMNAYYDKYHRDDCNIGGYTPTEFEETFNGDNNAELHGTTYFIKIFA